MAPNLSNKIVKLFNKNLLCGISISSSWEQDANINNKIIFFLIQKIQLGYLKQSLNTTYLKTLKTAKEMINEVGLYFVDNDLGRIGGDQTISDLKNFISDAGSII